MMRAGGLDYVAAGYVESGRDIGPSIQIELRLKFNRQRNKSLTDESQLGKKLSEVRLSLKAWILKCFLCIFGNLTQQVAHLRIEFEAVMEGFAVAWIHWVGTLFLGRTI